MRLTAIWVYLSSQPLLWLTLTVGVYWLAKRVYEATNGFALLRRGKMRPGAARDGSARGPRRPSGTPATGTGRKRG